MTGRRPRLVWVILTYLALILLVAVVLYPVLLVCKKAFEPGRQFALSASPIPHDVTLDHLALTGGSGGIYALYAADSQRLTVSNSDIFGNRVHGIFLDPSNTDALLSDNKVHNNSGALDSTGIYLRGAARMVVRRNDVYGNSKGIVIDNSSALADRSTVRDNSVHDNTLIGIDASVQVFPVA